jgi:sugar lactone lactonase YvrE
MQWGSPGTGNSQFNTVHGIDIDRDRRVYVSDRGNMRIQIFDENGKYLDQFGGLRQPQHVMVTADGHLGIVGGNNNKVTKFDLKGKLIASWGTQGTFPGGLWNMHQLSVDSDGNLYIAEATGGRTQKFRPRPGADRSRLIGPPPALMPLATN